MKRKLAYYKIKLSGIIIDDEKRVSFRSKLVYMAFALVGLVMSLINVFTQRIPLLISTAAFGLMCLLNLILTQRSEKGRRVAEVLFMIEIAVLFGFFIVTGGTDNFSVVWLLLLPTLGLFFFGIRRGTLLCLFILLFMTAMFHVPALRGLCTDYGDTFRLRFPVVFLCSYFVSLLLEFVRTVTGNELNRLRMLYEDRSKHDYLTGILNRSGEKESLLKMVEYKKNSPALAMIDLDHFKHFNDTYGHGNGDILLKELTSLIQETLPAESVFFRWGGEEFMITYFDHAVARKNTAEILEKVRNNDFILEDGSAVRVTLSLGLAFGSQISSPEDFNRLEKRADTCLYMAKEGGRNCIVTENDL